MFKRLKAALKAWMEALDHLTPSNGVMPATRDLEAHSLAARRAEASATSTARWSPTGRWCIRPPIAAGASTTCERGDSLPRRDGEERGRGATRAAELRARAGAKRVRAGGLAPPRG
jgi:hypothetical protein